MSIRTLLKRFFTDKHGKLAVAQFPNLPLITWFVSTVIARLVHGGSVHSIARLIACISLAVWALLELTSGLSSFRRVLGGVVLILLIISLL